MRIVLERTSHLRARAEIVWRHAVSMAGVNAELAPVVMTHPTERSELPDQIPLGKILFTSTLKLAGIPFDRHQLTLVELDPGHHFQEDSHSVLHRRWRHRRTVTPADGGCDVRDLVEVEPRLPGTAWLTRRVVGHIFDRRHRVLVELFGERALR